MKSTFEIPIRETRRQNFVKRPLATTNSEQIDGAHEHSPIQSSFVHEAPKSIGLEFTQMESNGFGQHPIRTHPYW